MDSGLSLLLLGQMVKESGPGQETVLWIYWTCPLGSGGKLTAPFKIRLGQGAALCQSAGLHTVVAIT